MYFDMPRESTVEASLRQPGVRLVCDYLKKYFGQTEHLEQISPALSIITTANDELSEKHQFLVLCVNFVQAQSLLALLFCRLLTISPCSVQPSVMSNVEAMYRYSTIIE